MTAFECAKTVWLKTIFGGTIIVFSLLFLLSLIAPHFIPLIFIIPVFSLMVSFPLFLLIFYILDYTLFLNEKIETKLFLIITAILSYSLLTILFLSFFFTNTLFDPIIIAIILPYAFLCVLFVYQEATIFYNQDEIS